MIAEKINGTKWKQTTMKKLLSFGEKSPCLLGIKTGSYQGQEGVFISHKNSGAEYFFPWDYEVDPKSFIHDIKEFIKNKHYPLLVETEYEDHQLTSEELADMVQNGLSVKDLPKYEKRVKSKKLWRIDKVILWKDCVILEPVSQTGEVLSDTQYRYKYNKSLVVFLKKYRSGEFESIEAAGDEFFKNSMLINEIVKKI